MPLAQKQIIAMNVVYDPYGSSYQGCPRCHGKGVVPNTSPVSTPGTGQAPFKVIGYRPCPDAWHLLQPATHQ